jgi:hypothetical protein
MVPNITAILQRLTGEWAAPLQPEAMLAACGEVGYTGWRDRVLTPVTTMQRFLLQILHGNTACRHLPHRSGGRCRAAAYGHARATLPRRCIALLLERLGRAADLAALDRQRWQVDTSLAQLQTTRPMEVWHGQTVSRVLKELTVFALVDNLVRLVMWHAAMRQHMGVEQISVLDALRWLSTPSTGSP